MPRSLIFIIAIILVLAGAGFIWYQRGGTSSAPTGNNAIELEARLSDLRRITQIRLDTSILQDPIFRSLEPTPPTPPSEQPAGRSNPFLPFR